MKPTRRYWVALAAFYGATLAIVAMFALMPAASVEGTRRDAYLAMLADAAPALVYAAGILLFVCAAVLRWAFRRYPLAARQLADRVRVLTANPGYKVVSTGGPEMSELAHAINRLAETCRVLERDLENRGAEAVERAEDERNRFAALMSELSEGVLVCNADGRILLYNARAAELLAPAPKTAAPRIHYLPLGLGRSVFGLLDRDQVVHALDRIQQQLQRGVERPCVRSVTTAANGALLRVLVAPSLDAGRRVTGMVVTLDDVSGVLGKEGQRLKLLQALATGLRAPAANLRVAVESLVGFPDMEPSRRAQFVDIAAVESQRLTERLDTALADYADALKGSLALEDMSIADLLTVVQRRLADDFGIAAPGETADEAHWVRVDSFGFVQAISALTGRLQAEHGASNFRLRAGARGQFAEFDLIWTGESVGSDVLARWETEPMRIGPDETPLTLTDVLERHGSEIWSEADKSRRIAWFRFLLPLGEPVATVRSRASDLGSRPEYYDFDLFDRVEPAGALERRLEDLSYTVFDTETTGLEPSAGDEIISIGAVRIVNGRLLKSEVFEQLVNPRRPISREATRIHGLDNRALAGAPPIGDVLPEFRRFCEDTILVAHNAAFDMRFLELQEPTTGVRFEQPVLDTLLLSAAVHASFEIHHLDAIAERLGVRVIGRHTALGDALLTGEVFLKLLPLLAERGIVTLRQALDASRETYHSRLQY